MSRTGRTGATLATLALLLACVAPASADEPSRLQGTIPVGSAQADALVARLRADPTFGGTAPETRWRWQRAPGSDDERVTSTRPNRSLSTRSEAPEAGAFSLATLLAWALAVALVAVLSWWLANLLRGTNPVAALRAVAGARGTQTHGRVPAGGLTPAWRRELEAAIAAGDADRALALLYAATLRAFAVQFDLEFPAETTEYEAVRASKGRVPSPAIRCLRAIADARAVVCYGHASVARDELAALLDLHDAAFAARTDA